MTLRFVETWSIYQDCHQEVSEMVMRNRVHPGEVLREDVLADLGLGWGRPRRGWGSPGWP